jgi:hypothetical protein
VMEELRHLMGQVRQISVQVREIKTKRREPLFFFFFFLFSIFVLYPLCLRHMVDTIFRPYLSPI